MMDTLVEEHVIARRAVGQLLLDKERFISGESSAMSDMKGQIELLLDLLVLSTSRKRMSSSSCRS